MVKYYFDTSIWLDIYEKRGYNGKIAKILLRKIIKETYTLYYSDINIQEVKKLGYTSAEIAGILRISKPGKVRIVLHTKEQYVEAAKVCKQRSVPLRDVLHAIIVRDNELVLVSRDRHFQKLKDVTKARLPEELI